jgi:MoxR-like ATPase
MSELLKRRCLHLYIPFPERKLEREIVRVRVPRISEVLRRQLVHFIHQVRELDLKKPPSVSETIDWARVLVILHAPLLDPDMVKDTLNVFLKYQEDISAVNEHLHEMTRKAVNAG